MNRSNLGSFFVIGDFAFYIIMSCGIYKITAQDGKIYIGKSKNIEKRWQGYKSAFTKLSGQPDLYCSFKKYGWFNHTFEIIEECNEEEIGCREFYWQHFYDVLSENGLNMKYGSCDDIPFQEQLFDLKNSYFRKSVLLYLYKNDNIENKNFNIRKYKQRRGEKLPKKERKKEVDKRASYKYNGYKREISPETRIKLRNRSNFQVKKVVIDLETGVFYNSLRELCELYNFSYEYMKRRLQDKCKVQNNTQFIYA